jgi:hypothetical protein
VKACAWCKEKPARAKSVTCGDSCARSWRRKRRPRLFSRLYVNAPALPAPLVEQPVSRTAAQLLAQFEREIAELERLVSIRDRIRNVKKQLGLFGEDL